MSLSYIWGIMICVLRIVQWLFLLFPNDVLITQIWISHSAVHFMFFGHILLELWMCSAHRCCYNSGCTAYMLFKIRKLVQFNHWNLCCLRKGLYILFCYFLFSSHPLTAERFRIETNSRRNKINHCGFRYFIMGKCCLICINFYYLSTARLLNQNPFQL